MKKIKIKTALILAALLVTFYVFPGCEEAKNPMVEQIVDMNSNITSVDKTVSQPGDTVTFTGTDLDRVYKILLNEDIVPVVFEATSTELKMIVPSLAPLGDIITISLFFSGKGLAQRVIKLISPPQIMAVTPSAAHAGDELTVMGRELYLARTIKVGGIETSFTLIDDKNLIVNVPDGFAGGDLVIVTEAGGETVSPLPVILGTEILVTDIDHDGDILNSYSAYGNSSGVITSEDFPRNSVFTITIEDTGTSWGANCDFNLQSMPATLNGETIDLTKVEMWGDVKASKTLSINFMVGKAHNPPGLWGRMREVTQQWQTIIVPFTDLGQGYSNDPITDDPLIPFEEYTLIKWSLPAQASAGNFGETITLDNVKFIIRD